MNEIVVAPQGRDAIDVGHFDDDAGDRFVALSFTREEDRVIVTMTPALFLDFVDHLNTMAQIMRAP